MAIYLFSVEVEFNEDTTLSDKDLMKVANNIARAIVREANSGEGIAPDEVDTYTKTVRVSPFLLDKTVIKDVF